MVFLCLHQIMDPSSMMAHSVTGAKDTIATISSVSPADAQREAARLMQEFIFMLFFISGYLLVCPHVRAKRLSAQHKRDPSRFPAEDVILAQERPSVNPFWISLAEIAK